MRCRSKGRERRLIRGLSLIVVLGLLGWEVRPVQGAPFGYGANFFGHTVTVFDTATNSVVADVAVGPSPWGVAVHPAGTFVYVANALADSVSILETATYRVIATVGVAAEPISLAVHPSGTFVYVAHNSTSVSVIDTATNTLTTTIPVPFTMDAASRGIAVHPSGAVVYVANEFDNTLSVIATATNSVVATVPTGTRPDGVALHPSGNLIYVADHGYAFGPQASDAHAVSVIDTATGSVVATVPVGRFPSGVAVHPAGKFAYVANSGDGSVSVIATASNTVVATVPVGGNPFGVATHPGGTAVYVSNVGGQGVSVIDTARNEVVATVSSGPANAFGQFIGPQLPGVSLTIDRGTLHPGDLLTVTATTYPGGGDAKLVDGYVELHEPGGRVLYLEPTGTLTTDRRPVVSRWPVGAFHGEIFRYTTGDVPGSYRLRSYLTEPGTSDVLGLVAQAPFTVGP